MRKLLISILSVALGAALIYGATMAWFTDTADVADTTFTAGTVTLGVTDIPDNVVNVNPGDSYDPTWTFEYTGSKAVYIRVKYDWTFLDQDRNPLDPGILDPIDASKGWTNGDDGYMYFINYEDSGILMDPRFPGSVAGVVANEDPREIPLQLTGKFNGADMNNDYQGSVLTIGGTIQAIQASHEFNDVTEPDGWTWDGFDDYHNPEPTAT